MVCQHNAGEGGSNGYQLCDEQVERVGTDQLSYGFEQRTQMRAVGPQSYRVPQTKLVDVVGKDASQVMMITGMEKTHLKFGGILQWLMQQPA